MEGPTDKPTKIQTFLQGLKDVEQQETAKRAIRDLIAGKGSIPLLETLSKSGDPVARKFMRALGDFISKMDPEDYK